MAVVAIAVRLAGMAELGATLDLGAAGGHDDRREFPLDLAVLQEEVLALALAELRRFTRAVGEFELDVVTRGLD